jgi:hypothetical protein
VGASDERLRAALKAHRALREKGDSPKNDVLAQAVLFNDLVGPDGAGMNGHRPPTTSTQTRGTV